MDMRREHRFPTNQGVRFTELGTGAAAVAAQLVNFSATGASIIVAREVRLGTALRIEWGSTLLFGTVIHCTPQGRDFSLGVELEDARYGKRAKSLRRRACRSRAVGSRAS